MNYNLNIREVTYALSEALDLVGIDDILHGKRVAYMAAEVAKELDWDKNTIDMLIALGMLHDCGVSSTYVHTHLVNELDWNNSDVHAIIGEKLLKKTAMYAHLATYVRYHHTHWDAFPETLTTQEKEISNLIYLVDRVDALRAQMSSLGVKAIFSIEEVIKKYVNTMFCPKLAEAFLRISSKKSFWFYLENEALDSYLHEWIKGCENHIFSFEEIKEVALMFANIVDAKSKFTAEHSIGVSMLSRYLAELFNLPEENCEHVELAGLLHDLGKLRVNDDILNKPMALNADETLSMSRHAFDSDIILRKITGFKDIARIASLHHEKLDGEGYPYRLGEEEIPFTARIIAVADIFQALVQDRPYRYGLSKEEAYDMIDDLCTKNQLDKNIVLKLKEYLPQCYDYACAKTATESFCHTF
ncbi:HD domain-containing phosphohydrolase [Sulfurospirillum arsenophilum]|uniref:HD domain-containing phosphohydrolase n=1 Tax=Sulfurospirillum arsenophilum TaxID=56698 RepID=UPI0005AA7358|nr:HD domain-containing phosphohydrolase [Sulfurospirillum arsenophilum]